MSEQQHPAIMCDGADPSLGCPDTAVEMDYTLGGLGHLVVSETQLPPGWTGDKPGARGNDQHWCPDCTRERQAAPQ